MDLAAAKRALHAIRELMEANRDYLIELDSAIGDGDLGLTMTKAFVTADDQAAESEETDIGMLFSRAGMAMSKAAPSTMGTLVATGFMRGGKAVKGQSELGTPEIAAFFRAFADGLMERGKSKPGEKTIIDLMDPVATALEEAAAAGTGASELPKLVAARTEEALEAVKGMISQHGKAAIYREQTQGKPDPGAIAGSFIVQGFFSVL